MISLNTLPVWLGFVLAVNCAVGNVAAHAAGCGGGWIRVGGGCDLPEDLSIGDQIEVSIGSAVSQRGAVVGFAVCDGQCTYYTSSEQRGCGWRDAITAYARNTPSTIMQGETATAPDVFRLGARQ